MKKTLLSLLAVVALALMSLTASAAGIDLPRIAQPEEVKAGECTPPTFLKRTASGLRCPNHDGWEGFAAGIAVIGAFAGILHASGAVQIFPLNGAGSAFSGL